MREEILSKIMAIEQELPAHTDAIVVKNQLELGN